jgi:hypothetical protein
MKSKNENQKKAQLYHEYRKNDMIKKNLEESLSDKVLEKDEMKKKLDNIISTNEFSKLQDVVIFQNTDGTYQLFNK